LQSASRHNASFINEDNTLRYILTLEGRALPDGNGGFEYQYFLKDHLGNTRVTFAQTGTVLQEDSYYPFGMAQSGLAYQSGTSYENKYLYNGKELQDDFGLEWYVPENLGFFESLDFRGCSKNNANHRFAIFRHYGARFYDAVLGRWHVTDPMSEIYYSWSPFNYALNNPLWFIDPNGMWVGDFYDQKGNYLGTDGIEDKKNYVVTDRKEAKQIKKATKKGENYTGTVNSKVELPGLGVRSAMGEAVDRAGTNSFHEEGGVIANMSDGSKKVVNAKPGADADPSVDGYAEIAVMDAANPSEVKGYGTLDGTFHTHPNGTVEKSSSSSSSVSGQTIGGKKTTSYFVQSPSDVDISNHAARSKSGLVTGNSYVLGTGNNTVYIYNGKGVQATFPLQKFRNKLKNE